MKAGAALRKFLERHGDAFLVNGRLKYRLVLEVDFSGDSGKWTGYDGEAVEQHVLAEGAELEEILGKAFDLDGKRQTRNPALAWVKAHVRGWERLRPAQLIAKARAAGKLPKVTEKNQASVGNFRRALERRKLRP